MFLCKAISYDACVDMIAHQQELEAKKEVQ